MEIHQDRKAEILESQSEMLKTKNNYYFYKINSELREGISKKFENKSLQELHEIVKQLK
jgi:hypothetical protein